MIKISNKKGGLNISPKGDVARNLLTIKVERSVGKRLESFKINISSDVVETYTDKIAFLLNFYEQKNNYYEEIRKFIDTYIDSANHCLNCKDINSEHCKKVCNNRKVFGYIEECQTRFKTLFK